MVKVKIKKWGNSLGIVIPKELVEERNLKEKDEVEMELFKISDFSDVFGSIPFRKGEAQKMKDKSRRDWDR